MSYPIIVNSIDGYLDKSTSTSFKDILWQGRHQFSEKKIQGIEWKGDVHRV